MAYIKSQNVTHSFGGGWATDYGSTFYGGADGNHIRYPWLNEAQNIQFGLDGSIQKFSGTTRLNSNPIANTLTADGAILNLYDYWRHGTAGSPTRRLVAKVGTQLFYTTSTNFTRIPLASFAANVPYHFSTFNDLLIIGDSDQPQSWDQTTFQALAGTPPAFTFSTPHAGRHWAAGVASAPSRLYYSAVGNPEDWVGSGSGSIDIDPGDGDKITGILSHKRELFIFKGPYKLSIHRLSGTTPDDFTRTLFVRGVSTAHQNTIFELGNDFAFWSPHGTCHSLAATDVYGDYAQSFLNYPILSWCRNTDWQLNFTNMKLSRAEYWQAVSDPLSGYSLLAYTGVEGSLFPTRLLMMDWKFISQGEQYPRFSRPMIRGLHSLTYGLDIFSPTPRRIMGGDSTGFVHRFGTNSYAHKEIPLRSHISTPYTTYGTEYETKTPSDLSLSLDPKGSTTISVMWGGPNQAKQTSTVTQPSETGLDSFVLDTSVLGEVGSQVAFVQEMGGEFRSIQYDVIHEDDVDVSLRGFNVVITPNAASTENNI